MKETAVLAAALLCAVVLSCGAWAESLVNPHLRTDRSVDTRSARTIVRDLVRPEMTNEEKALALFHWVRRVIYHSGPEEPMRHDFNKMIHLFGYGSCYMQTHPLSHLWQQLGFPCRNWVHNDHHMIEVYYEGAWHCFDPHMTFYVYNRATPRAVAGVAELRADPTLAADAVKEGRAGEAFLICGDAPTWFSGDSGWVLDHPFFPHRGADEEFGGIRLRRGERYVRTWQVGRYYTPHAFLEKYAPYHTCGLESDRKDPINFPYWEPYAWQDRAAASHRHIGSGYLEYAPDLRRDGWREGALRFVNLTSGDGAEGPALHPAVGKMEAEVIFTVACPYLLTGASLDLTGRIGASGDRVRVSVSKGWKPGGVERDWTEVLNAAHPGALRQHLDLSSAVEGSLEGYWVRIVMQADDARGTGLDTLKLHTDFQLNPYALPQLLPGENRLFVTAARAENPWKLRITWREGAGWQTPREYAATIQGSSHEAVVKVAGEKLPRMETLEFSVDP
jgi:hypothetical protein